MSQAPQLVEGYVVCPGHHHVEATRLVRDDVAHCTGGLCLDCFAAEGGKRIREIELVMRGRRLVVPVGDGKRKTKRYRPHRNARKALNAKARERARKRVADLVPELYVVLLAEERAKLGLPALPVQIAVHGGNPMPDIEALERSVGLS